MDILIELIRQKSKKRAIYIWGAWEIGKYLTNELEKNDIEVAGYIDSASDRKEYAGKNVILPEKLLEKKEEMFVVLSIVEHQSVIEFLDGLGWNEFEDFYYPGKIVKLYKCNNYRDIYGNKVDGQVHGPTLSLSMGSYVKIAKNVSFGKNVSIICTVHSKIIFEDGCTVGDNVTILVHQLSTAVFGKNTKVGDNVKMEIKMQSDFSFGVSSETQEDKKDRNYVCNTYKTEIKENAYILCSNHGQIKIGKRSDFGRNLKLVICGNTRFICGEDCLFSYDISVRGDDGHTIIDSKNKCIYKKRMDTILENHVWVGVGANLLPGTYIGQNSIVGAGALTTKKYPGASLIVGVPAKVTREDVTWCSSRNITYEEYEKKFN